MISNGGLYRPSRTAGSIEATVCVFLYFVVESHKKKKKRKKEETKISFAEILFMHLPVDNPHTYPVRSSVEQAD